MPSGLIALLDDVATIAKIAAASVGHFRQDGEAVEDLVRDAGLALDARAVDLGAEIGLQLGKEVLRLGMRLRDGPGIDQVEPEPAEVGPLTRDVTDCALLLSHMVGRDPCDCTSTGLPEEVRLPTAERLDGRR